MTLAGTVLFTAGLLLLPVVAFVTETGWGSAPLFIAGAGLLLLGEGYRRAKPYLGNRAT
jgi:hypothetical protein